MTVVNTHIFKLGAQVHCSDGSYGKLAKIAIDPSFYEVVYLITEEGVLLKRARAFPIETVERAEEDNIYLSFSSNELVNYPEYSEEVIERPLENSYTQPAITLSEVGVTGANYSLDINVIREKIRIGIPDELIVIGSRTNVTSEEGESWNLEAVQVHDEVSEIISFAVQRGLIFSEYEHFPIEWAESITEERITLKLTADSVKPFKAEQEAIEASMLEPTAVATRSVLVAEVENALEDDIRTRGYPIQVSQDDWKIILNGRVNTIEAHEAAAEIAANHPDVSSVVNNLFVS